MTKTDFKNETFGYAQRGELGFRSGAVYGKEYKDMHERTAFLKKCFDYYVFSDGEKVKLSFKKDSKNVLAKLWKNAKDLKDFKKLIMEDKEARLMQFTGEWLKDDTEFLQSFVSDDAIYTMSDAGGLKIGTNGFNVIAPNGAGDGSTVVSFLKKDSFNSSAFNFWTSINGNEINLYSYDCGNEIARTVNGKYGIYFKDGLIVFEEWDLKC